MSVSSGALVGQKLGKYELLALLAVGGTAEIYLARIGGEAGFEKYLVVKCLLDHLADEPEYVKMFLDEARLGAQLDHSNIVQTLELGEQDGRYFMAMEYLAGMSLAQLARRTQERVPGGYMPINLVLGLAAQTCAGLNYAHRKAHAGGKQLNLVHRDISPQNLVVSFDGVLKIVDFGIAKADMRDTHTRSGTIKGKFAYMSPEQCLAKHVDHRTDIFALGVILHELLCARRLFKRSTTYETYEAIIKGKVPRPSEVNPQLDRSLDDVVLKALQYNREDRYESAEAFGQVLLQTLHKRGVSISASDVATYYETYFEPELEAHHKRMRELITGQRKRAGDESMNWDAAEVIEELNPSDVVELSDSDVEALDPDTADPDLDPDTVPPEGDDGATRIEMNPLEKAQQAFAPASVAATSVDHLEEHDTQDLSGELEALLADTAANADPVPADKPPPGVPASPLKAGPSEQTIGPGQLSATDLGWDDSSPSIQAESDGDKKPEPAPQGKSKPKKTVLGMAPPDVARALAAARAPEDDSSPPPSPPPESSGATSPKKTLFAPGGGPGPALAAKVEAESKALAEANARAQGADRPDQPSQQSKAAAKTLFAPGANNAAAANAAPPPVEDPGSGPQPATAGANAKTLFAPGANNAAAPQAPVKDPGSGPQPATAGANAKTLFAPGANNTAAAPNADAAPRPIGDPGSGPVPGPRPFGPPPQGTNPVPPDTLPPVGDKAKQAAPGPRPGYHPPPRQQQHPGAHQQHIATQIRPAQPPWLLAVVFLVSLGVGLGLTLLIGS